MSDLQVAPPLKYSTIAHGDLEVLNPLSVDAIGEAFGAIEALGLPEAPRILDLGCGRAALLAEALTRLGGVGRGLDRNPAFVADGQRLLARRGLAERATVEVAEIGPDTVGEGAWDLVMCVGARPFGATLEQNLAGIARLVAPGGGVILGEGYWRRAPEPEYLELLGARPEEMPTRAELDGIGLRAGLRVRRVVEAGFASWDAYEAAYRDAMLAWCAANPEDPDAARFEARARRWYAAYERWGRTTLGFALLALG